MLSEFQRSALGADIIEDRGNIIYAGIFKRMTDENGTENCLIKRIEQKKDPETGVVTIRTQYAEGNNSDMTLTWADREKYEYKYPMTK